MERLPETPAETPAETLAPLPTGITAITKVTESKPSEALRKSYEGSKKEFFSPFYPAGCFLIAAAYFLKASLSNHKCLPVGLALLTVAVLIALINSRDKWFRVTRHQKGVIKARLDLFVRKVEGYNRRLEALHAYEAVENAPNVDDVVVNKYADERQELLLEQGRLDQAVALVNFESALADFPPDGRFRDTRDVTDFVFAQQQRLRVADEEVASILEEDPRAAEPFRALERAGSRKEK